MNLWDNARLTDEEGVQALLIPLSPPTKITMPVCLHDDERRLADAATRKALRAVAKLLLEELEGQEAKHTQDF